MASEGTGRLESKEVDLRAEFTKQQERAVNLAPLKQQLAQMEQVLQQMSRQPPSKTEMPDLIIDIADGVVQRPDQRAVRAGAGAGQEFYAESRQAAHVVGSYHQFVLSSVAWRRCRAWSS